MVGDQKELRQLGSRIRGCRSRHGVGYFNPFQNQSRNHYRVKLLVITMTLMFSLDVQPT